jgi:hypothetical protein
MKAFLYNADSSFLKSWSPGVGRGHNRENHIFSYVFIEKKKSSPPEPAD